MRRPGDLRLRLLFALVGACGNGIRARYRRSWDEQAWGDLLATFATLHAAQKAVTFHQTGPVAGPAGTDAVTEIGPAVRGGVSDRGAVRPAGGGPDARPIRKGRIDEPVEFRYKPRSPTTTMASSSTTASNTARCPTPRNSRPRCSASTGPLSGYHARSPPTAADAGARWLCGREEVLALRGIAMVRTPSACRSRSTAGSP
jgi:hypothetical protein